MGSRYKITNVEPGWLNSSVKRYINQKKNCPLLNIREKGLHCHSKTTNNAKEKGKSLIGAAKIDYEGYIVEDN